MTSGKITLRRFDEKTSRLKVTKGSRRRRFAHSQMRSGFVEAERQVSVVVAEIPRHQF
jgi:hypothetical protein